VFLSAQLNFMIAHEEFSAVPIVISVRYLLLIRGRGSVNFVKSRANSLQAAAVARVKSPVDEGLLAEGEFGSVMELSLSRSHNAQPAAMDGPAALAKSQTHGEAGQHVSQASKWNPELLHE
jgi:hypothetical protein